MKIVSIKETTKKQLQSFDCGTEELNDYLKRYALQNDKKNIGKTFIAEEKEEIIGFYTLSIAQIGFEELSDEQLKGLPKYPIPCIRIARLVIDKRYQHNGIGSLLLKDAFLRIVNISHHTGVYFVVADAKQQSIDFYRHYGFLPLKEKKQTYVLPVKTIQKAIDGN